MGAGKTLLQKSESVSFMKYVPGSDPEVYNMCENHVATYHLLRIQLKHSQCIGLDVHILGRISNVRIQFWILRHLQT